MQVNRVGCEMTAAYAAMMLLTSALNESNKNGKVKVRDIKKNMLGHLYKRK